MIVFRGLGTSGLMCISTEVDIRVGEPHGLQSLHPQSGDPRGGWWWGGGCLPRLQARRPELQVCAWLCILAPCSLRGELWLESTAAWEEAQLTKDPVSNIIILCGVTQLPSSPVPGLALWLRGTFSRAESTESRPGPSP